MLEEVSIAGLRARQAERRARIVAGVQSVVIFLLLVAVAEDYNHNEYFQAWADANLAGFGFLLNGTLATFYAGVLVAMFLRRLPDQASQGVGWRADSCKPEGPVTGILGITIS
jgi:hypothetical protein